SETWMAENLNYATTNSYCYEDKEENCAKYGRLYTWAAAVRKTEEECGFGKECNLGTGDIRGICPTGWHLPSKEEWENLFEAVGGQSTAGAKLKSQTGFSALPAGNREDNGNYASILLNAYFWSSSEYYGNSAYNVLLNVNNEKAYLSSASKDFGYSVRCLKDKPAE
ncbi:MAG: fibrobacter succinogenes major paralogous domain-containing protein, partial [Hallerella sp.]|nr:fibrobacter succinogenes major paralogous domain-containing protein [Hallerella sp.]